MGANVSVVLTELQTCLQSPGNYLRTWQEKCLPERRVWTPYRGLEMIACPGCSGTGKCMTCDGNGFVGERERQIIKNHGTYGPWLP